MPWDELARDVEVTFAVSDIDDAVLVMVDTGERTGQVRVVLNDGAIWDGDTEHHDPAIIATRVAADHVSRWNGADTFSSGGLRSAILAAIEEFYGEVTGEKLEARTPAVPTGLGAIVTDSPDDGAEPYIRISVIGDRGWRHPVGANVSDESILHILLNGGTVRSEGIPWEYPS